MTTTAMAMSSTSGRHRQAWPTRAGRTTWDGVRFADGRFPQTPVALCEVQGYTYAAYIAHAHFGERPATRSPERATSRRHAV